MYNYLKNIVLCKLKINLQGVINLKRFFNYSYGIDKLSKHLYIIGLILLMFRRSSTFGLVCIVYGTWRCLSKNTYKRHRELQSYENFISPLTKKFTDFINSINQNRQYRIFKCPNCSQKMRVPRHKGKITITCKKCGTSFKAKS